MRYLMIIIFLAAIACDVPPEYSDRVDDSDSIVIASEEITDRSVPADAIKILPENDAMPPVLHSDEYEPPVPLSAAINTGGAEDSPFVFDDRFYFFYTPDMSVPAEEQVQDGVTGIWVSDIFDGNFGQPKKVILQDSGKLAMDGCAFVENHTIWFCSVREGYTGVNWFLADYDDNWVNWRRAEFPDYVGEIHIYDGVLFFHSDVLEGKGGRDIWMLKDGEPVNIESINTEDDESMPFVNSEGIWFNRPYQGSPAIYRSRSVEGVFQEPELIISGFAGEPNLDSRGNIYFVHHYIDNGEMVEADIYVARKK